MWMGLHGGGQRIGFPADHEAAPLAWMPAVRFGYNAGRQFRLVSPDVCQSSASVQSLPDKVAVLCPPWDTAFPGAFFCASLGRYFRTAGDGRSFGASSEQNGCLAAWMVPRLSELHGEAAPTHRNDHATTAPAAGAMVSGDPVCAGLSRACALLEFRQRAKPRNHSWRICHEFAHTFDR